MHPQYAVKPRTSDDKAADSEPNTCQPPKKGATEFASKGVLTGMYYTGLQADGRPTGEQYKPGAGKCKFGRTGKACNPDPAGKDDTSTPTGPEPNPSFVDSAHKFHFE